MVKPYRAMMGPSMSLSCIRVISPSAHGLAASPTGCCVQVVPGITSLPGPAHPGTRRETLHETGFLARSMVNYTRELRKPHYGLHWRLKGSSNNAAAPFVFL